MHARALAPSLARTGNLILRTLTPQTRKAIYAPKRHHAYVCACVGTGAHAGAAQRTRAGSVRYGDTRQPSSFCGRNGVFVCACGNTLVYV